MPKVHSRRNPAPARTRLSNSQNFISDPLLTARLLGCVQFDTASTVLEIGPGKGALTSALLERIPQVLAVEADPQLSVDLIQRFSACRRLTVACGDFLDFPLPSQQFIVVANIPFDQTSAIIQKLTGQRSGIRAAYLVLQTEAADKLCGTRTGAPSLLSILLSIEFNTEKLLDIPRASFTPQPQVDAALICIKRRAAQAIKGREASLFKDLLCFVFPRGPFVCQTLRGLLSQRQITQLAQEVNLDNRARLRDVSFSQWLAIARQFRQLAGPRALKLITGSYRKLSREQDRLQKRHRRPGATRP